MNDIERAKLSTDITSALESSIIKGEELDLLGNELTLVNITNGDAYIKNGENFIIAMFKYEGCDDFYKCLLHVKDAKSPRSASLNIKHSLVDDVKLYLEEGLTDRLQSQVNTHNELISGKYTLRIPYLQYPIMLDNIVGKYDEVYKSRKSMRVTNNIPSSVAHMYSERYCDGDRDLKVLTVIKELGLVLNFHNKLYIKHVVTEYDKTGCIIKALTHGIKKMLPRPVRIYELERDLWENMVLASIEEIRNYHITFPLPPTSYILKEITSKFKGGSKFTVLDLASTALSYNNLNTTDSVLQAVSIMYPDPMRNYFRLYYGGI